MLDVFQLQCKQALSCSPEVKEKTVKKSFNIGCDITSYRSQYWVNSSGSKLTHLHFRPRLRACQSPIRVVIPYPQFSNLYLVFNICG